jgi:hypothetical protein
MAPVENDERRPMAKRSKISGWLDAVVIVLVPLMRRFVLFSKVPEPADESGFRLFRKTHHHNLLALPLS